MSGIKDDLRWAIDPVAFAAEALRVFADPWQAQVLRSTSKQTLLNCSRQTGKSTVAAIKADHRALYHPKSLILLVSPSLRQSTELFRKTGELLRQLDSPPELIEDSQLTCTLGNESRIVSLPSTEATIRGYSSVDLIIEDEAARVSDELFRAVRPMLAVSRGRLILLSTPHGQRGHFYDTWSQGGATWERVEVRATECPRITPEFLAEERAVLGEPSFAEEYLCKFLDSEDRVFPDDLVLRALSDEFRPFLSEF